MKERCWTTTRQARAAYSQGAAERFCIGPADERYSAGKEKGLSGASSPGSCILGMRWRVYTPPSLYQAVAGNGTGIVLEQGLQSSGRAEEQHRACRILRPGQRSTTPPSSPSRLPLTPAELTHPDFGAWGHQQLLRPYVLVLCNRYRQRYSIQMLQFIFLFPLLPKLCFKGRDLLISFCVKIIKKSSLT